MLKICISSLLAFLYNKTKMHVKRMATGKAPITISVASLSGNRLADQADIAIFSRTISPMICDGSLFVASALDLI